MMFEAPYYNAHTKHSVIAFGRLFSNIKIVRVNPDDQTKNQTINVPLSYASKEKALVRIQQDPTLTNHVHTVLPLMSFEITSFAYDASRKLNRMNRVRNRDDISYAQLISHTTVDSTTITSNALFANVIVGSSVTGAGIQASTVVAEKINASTIVLNRAATITGGATLTFAYDTLKQTFTPVPYNLDVSLYILTKSQEDNLQILEQILPFFTPEYTVEINAMPELNLKNDLPIVLNSVSMVDEFDGDFQTRRFVTTTLNFTLKVNMYGGLNRAGVILKTFTKFVPVKDFAEMNGAHETVISTGTVPGAPIIDEWVSGF